MQILAIEKEIVPVDSKRHASLLREEAARVWELKKQGIIRQAWFNRDRNAVLMLEAASLEEAGQYMVSLPLAREGLIRFELIELRPYDGFERLIGR